MRILQVIHDFVPETMAGAEINTHKLSVDLQNRLGHEVHIFCRGWNLECEPYLERDEIVDNLRVRRIELGRGGLPNRWRRHDPHVDAALRRMIEQVQPELVHIQHFIYLSTNIVAVAKEFGIPVVVSLRNFWFRCPWGTLLYHDDSLCHRQPGTGCLSCLWPDRLSRKRNVIPWRQINPLLIGTYAQLGERAPLPRPVDEILPSLATWAEEFRAALLLADHIHSPSEFLRDQLVDFGIPKERISVVTNGFRYDPAMVIPKSPSDKLRFGMIGMHRLKGLHVLVDAFSKMPAERTELRIYGQVASQHYAEEQQRRAKGAPIFFCGTYSQSEIYHIFSTIDVLVVPSIWYENCPTVIREAFATGTPVVASDIGGMAEAIEDGMNGLLFQAGNPESLRAKLEQLIANPAQVAALAARIPPPLTVEQCTDGIVEIYTRVMEVNQVC